jgi:hypothetical protein
MSYCGSTGVICNMDSDEDSVYTPPSERCETKFHNCEADCAASLKRQWGPSTSEPPVELGNGTKTGGGTATIGGGSEQQEANLSEALASSEQAETEAKRAADSFEVWDKTGHLGDLPKMLHYVAEAKAASDRAQALAAAHPGDLRLQENALHAKGAYERVQASAARGQKLLDAIQAM